MGVAGFFLGSAAFVVVKFKFGFGCDMSVRGLSLVWLGHQLPKLTTRVQIPETALNRLLQKSDQGNYAFFAK